MEENGETAEREALYYQGLHLYASRLPQIVLLACTKLTKWCGFKEHQICFVLFFVVPRFCLSSFSTRLQYFCNQSTKVKLYKFVLI